MALVEIKCETCGRTAFKQKGSVNRARKIGAPLYCSRACAGIARRRFKTPEQKKEEKRLYDIEYRRRNRDRIRAKKAEYFKRTYDPAKAAVERKKRMAQHVEYCRRPEYRQYKKAYDRQYRAKRLYGGFWEAYLLTLDIRNEVLRQRTDYEIRLENGTLNKRSQRRRAYERTHSKKPEIGPMGDITRGQRR